MTARDDDQARPPTLPELEQLLVRAATRRAAPRLRGRRRWALGLAAGSLVLAGGAAAAATGVLHISEGQTSSGTYEIDRRPVPAPVAGESRPGSICMQLQFDGSSPAYGCGERPTTARPFGLVVADTHHASGERVIYGLVTSDVARVSALGAGDRHTDAATQQKPSLPGRFFSIVTADTGRIELVGYDADGDERARIGSRAEPDRKPLSRADAIAQGDLAGFAPTIAAPRSFTYEGRPITPAEVAERELTCAQDDERVRCYDSPAELEAAHAGEAGGP